MTEQHPLTDEILERDFDYVPWLSDKSETQFTKDDMRAAYDLGYKAGYWKTTMRDIKQSDIETIIEDLEDAIGVCYKVDSTSEDHERSYPYVAGYSRAAMQGAVKDLRSLM